MLNQRIRQQGSKRKLTQTLTLLLGNANLTGFVTGRIYQGPLKNACLPGLNCYSCPGALGACPLGSLQNGLADPLMLIPFYVLGFLVLLGGILSRFVCGWLCPFGLIQEWLHRIPGRKWRPAHDQPLHKRLQVSKYVILAIFVVLLPFSGRLLSGYGSPAFCTYICPSGTLMAGIPLMLANMMFLVAITQHPEAFAKDYEATFGKKITLTTPNAGYEFIKLFVKNGLVLAKSDGDISKAVGTKGQTDPPIGVTAFDKMREVSQKGYKMAYGKGITPIEGINSPTYLAIGALSAHPNAAKLFIRWIMGDEKGGQGAVPFYETGCIMGRGDVPPPAATPTLAERNMWNPNVPALLKDYQQVTDFWLSLQ